MCVQCQRMTIRRFGWWETVGQKPGPETCGTGGGRKKKAESLMKPFWILSVIPPLLTVLFFLFRLDVSKLRGLGQSKTFPLSRPYVQTHVKESWSYALNPACLAKVRYCTVKRAHAAYSRYTCPGKKIFSIVSTFCFLSPSFHPHFSSPICLYSTRAPPLKKKVKQPLF